jgi:PDZ domain-containing protein
VEYVSDNLSETAARPARMSRRGWGGVLLGVAAAGTLGLAFVPAPYVIETPGPVYNTLGSAENEDGESTPLISVSGTPTYPTEGELSMLTVYVTGTPASHPSWLEVASAWLRPDYSVLPMELLYPAGTTQTDSENAGRIQMENSQQEAIAAALTNQGIPFTSAIVVAEATEGFPAAGLVEPGDIVRSADGVAIDSVSRLRAVIREAGIGNSVDLVVERDGEDVSLTVGVVAAPSDNVTPIIGILCGGEYVFPFSVDISLADVGGSSAGMMFALAIIDTITPGSLNGGENVAGTGEITPDGLVGPIGGIVQKAYGARDSGAEWLLVPADNCAELAGRVPDGLRDISVRTLDESMAALAAISSGVGVDDLPRCTSG